VPWEIPHHGGDIVDGVGLPWPQQRTRRHFSGQFRESLSRAPGTRSKRRGLRQSRTGGVLRAATKSVAEFAAFPGAQTVDGPKREIELARRGSGCLAQAMNLTIRGSSASFLLLPRHLPHRHYCRKRREPRDRRAAALGEALLLTLAPGVFLAWSPGATSSSSIPCALVGPERAPAFVCPASLESRSLPAYQTRTYGFGFHCEFTVPDVRGVQG